MRKAALLCVAVVLFFGAARMIPGIIAGGARAAPLPAMPTIASEYGYVYNLTAGTAMYEKAADTQVMPASITKLMTALVVLREKRGALGDTVTVQSGDLLAANLSQMGLVAGDVISFSGLIHGMLLPSGGDAAQAAARVVGNLLTASGGVSRFVTEMNAVATSLGMEDTVFTNTHGEDDAGQYTTARDVFKLLQEVWSEPVLMNVMESSVTTAVITGTNARSIFLSNSNPILQDAGVRGGKTGTWVWLSPAKTVFSLANVWTAPNGDDIAIVTLDADNGTDRQADQRAIMAQALLDFPSLATAATNGPGFVLLEDGTSRVLLENATDKLLTEES